MMKKEERKIYEKLLASSDLKSAPCAPGTLDMLVLKTLSRGANHGYGIAQHIQSVSDDALKVGEGSLYPALQRLLVNQWVTSSSLKMDSRFGIWVIQACLAI
mgnify:CR=1 FL=1